MLDAIKKVRNALSTKDLVAHLAHYLVRNGRIWASDGRVWASAPCPDVEDLWFLVRGDEFEKVLDRMPGKVKLTVEEDGLRLSSGRFRGVIKTLPADVFDLPDVESKMIKVPAGFVDTLRALRPFVSDDATRLWATTISFDGKRAVATSNVVLAQAPCKAKLAGLLPVEAVDFILGRSEELTHLAQGSGRMSFRWDDDSWMQTLLINDKMPPAVDTVLADMATPSNEITSEWREAYDRVASLSLEAVRFYPDKITGGGAFSEVEDEAETAMPDEAEYTVWDPRFLNPVVAVADTIDFQLWPKPCPWSGGGMNGVVIGRSS
jgi:hypothetical protein